MTAHMTLQQKPRANDVSDAKTRQFRLVDQREGETSSRTLPDNRVMQRQAWGTPSGPVAQLKTSGDLDGQKYSYNGKSVTVGKTMWAKLDPNDPKQGQSAEINTSQNDLMDAIRSKYSLKGNEVVKGHLLNDNLGGSALDANLFPITGEANKTHLHNVESVVKDVYAAGLGVYYTVDVIGAAMLTSPDASFAIKLADWNPQNDKIGQYATKNLNIHSHLDKPVKKRADLSGDAVKKKSKHHDVLKKKIAKTAKKKPLQRPKKRVSELTSAELAKRKSQPKKFSL